MTRERKKKQGKPRETWKKLGKESSAGLASLASAAVLASLASAAVLASLASRSKNNKKQQKANQNKQQASKSKQKQAVAINSKQLQATSSQKQQNAAKNCKILLIITKSIPKSPKCAPDAPRTFQNLPKSSQTPSQTLPKPFQNPSKTQPEASPKPNCYRSRSWNAYFPSKISPKAPKTLPKTLQNELQIEEKIILRKAHPFKAFFLQNFLKFRPQNPQILDSILDPLTIFC